MRVAELLAVWLAAGAASAQEAGFVDLTGALPFDAPFSSLAVAGEPPVVYVGTESGHVHVSRDRGRTWTSTAVHLRPVPSYAVERAAGRPDIERLEPADAPTPQPRPWDAYGFIELDDAFQPLPDPDDLVAYFFEDGLEPGFGAAWWGEERAGPADSRLADLFDATGADVRIWSSSLGGALRWLDDDVDAAVSVLAAAPSNPDLVFAGGGAGPLLRSADGGATWIEARGGASDVRAVAVDPKDARRVLAGTAGGLWISTDAGAFFAPVPGVDDEVRAIAFGDGRTLFLGTDGGVLRSQDGGASFRAVFEAEAAVHAVDAADARRVWVGTERGLFASADGGETFAPAGGLRFTGEAVPTVVARAGRAFAAIAGDVWASDDGGRTWRDFVFGGGGQSIRGAQLVGADLWMLHAGALTVWTPRAPRPALAALDELRGLTRSEPTVAQAVASALERSGASAAASVASHGRARWSAALPVVHAGLALRDDDLRADRRDFSIAGDDTGFSRGPYARFAWGVVALWDLPSLFQSADEAPSSLDGALEAEATIRTTVTALYRERRRLQLESISLPPRDPRARLLHALRMEELTAHLNALTGDLFPPSPAW